NSQHISSAGVNGDDRRFTQHNALVPNVHKGIRRPKINSNIVGKEALKLCKHERCLTTTRHHIKDALRPGSRRLRRTYRRFGRLRNKLEKGRRPWVSRDWSHQKTGTEHGVRKSVNAATRVWRDHATRWMVD